MTVDWPVAEPYLHEMIVKEADLDGFGHANNGRYIHWCEQAAWKHSEQLGLGLADYRRLDRAMVVRRSEYDYVQACHLDDALFVATWLAESGSTRMQRHFQVRRAGDEQVLLNGIWYLACVELSTGKVRRLPKEFIQTYEPAVQTVQA